MRRSLWFAHSLMELSNALILLTIILFTLFPHSATPKRPQTTFEHSLKDASKFLTTWSLDSFVLDNLLIKSTKDFATDSEEICDVTSRECDDCKITSTKEFTLIDTQAPSMCTDHFDGVIAISAAEKCRNKKFRLLPNNQLQFADHCVNLRPFQSFLVLGVVECQDHVGARFSIARLPNGLLSLVYIDASCKKHCVQNLGGPVKLTDCATAGLSIGVDFNWFFT